MRLVVIVYGAGDQDSVQLETSPVGLYLISQSLNQHSARENSIVPLVFSLLLLMTYLQSQLTKCKVKPGEDEIEIYLYITTSDDTMSSLIETKYLMGVLGEILTAWLPLISRSVCVARATRYTTYGSSTRFVGHHVVKVKLNPRKLIP